MMADFDPNASPVIVKPFMTRIENRSPKLKLHANLGQAKNAVGYAVGRGARGGKVWQWKDNEWVLLYDVAPGKRREELPWNLGLRTFTWEDRKTSRRVISVLAETADEANRKLEAHEDVHVGAWTHIESPRMGPWASRHTR